LAIGFLSLAVVGCESGARRIPVSGEVTLDGKPMNGGIVEFVPDPTKGNALRISCTSPISNGKFNLNTGGMKKADNGSGAPIGWFKIRYMNPNERGFDPTGKQKDDSPRVADRYRSDETTPLSIELTEPPPAEGYKIEFTSK